MRVIAPFAGRIEPETTAALGASGFAWQAVNVGGSDTAYTELLAARWQAGETFAVVEQDIVPWRGALAELEDCARPWCSFTYPLRDGMHAGLGCARFRGEFLRVFPSAVEDTLAESTEVHPAGFWCSLDDRLARSLTRLGAKKHVHQTPVGHLFPQPTHGCS